MSAVLTPQPRHIRKHSANVVQGGMPAVEGEDPFDLIGLPKGVEHLVLDLWIEPVSRSSNSLLQSSSES